MKSIIFVFALIAAVSCDVSHVVQGDGWFKDESGYHYTEPAVKLDEVVVEEAVIPAEEPVIVEEVVIADAPVEIAEPESVVADEVVEVVAPEEAPVVADAVAKVTNEYLPPSNDYLPPQSADAKKKRQIPVRRVYRRFVKKH
ncbi:unnamed protein product [Chironomus riparius]|uniref:Uncharacterized protein n=1 Tax=Chironomus riparius TaxID=315576 RepID=A0A9N9RQ89_9DIPT|nr:unnamed protein product [Chironomus riparius]